MIEGMGLAFASLILVVGLILLMAYALKRLNTSDAFGRLTAKSRSISITESQPIDAKNRLIVVRWRGQDYLLAVGQGSISRLDKMPAMTDSESSGDSQASRGHAEKPE